MRKKFTRMAAVLLSSALLFSSAGTTVFAAEGSASEAVIASESEEAAADDSSENLTEETAVPEEVSSAEETENISDETCEAVDTAEDDEETEEAAESIAEETEETADAELAPLDASDVLTVTDTFGNLYHPYKESDSKLTLFISGDIDIPTMTVTVNSSITAASSGTLAADKTLTGAFTASGSSVTLTDTSGKTYTVTVMQSDLPSMFIYLHGTDLSVVNANSKDIKYTGNDLTLYDPDGDNLNVQGSVEFKGRGNTTWTMAEKKGYQIKFDKKTSVLGMDKAKKWVLLANAFDDSLVRNAVGFDLASSLGMAYTPEYKFTDLWVDGEYRGTYMICEKCEIGSGRLDLSADDAGLFEWDQFFYAQEDFWTKDSLTGLYFSLKESNSEGSETTQLNNFSNKFDALYNYLKNTASTKVTTEKLSQYIDLESIAQYYLVTEFTYNVESWNTSFYWYQDGASDVLHMGPVWDFDSAMGDKKDFMTTSGYYAVNNTIMKPLLSAPAFTNYVTKYYNEHKSAFEKTAADAKALGAKLTSSAAMNYTRWKVLGTSNGKTDMTAYHSTYAAGVSYLTTWLTQRASAFSPEGYCNAALSNGTINITCRKQLNASSLTVAVWSAAGNQSDLVWIPMTKGSDGYWHASVAIRQFDYEGDFIFHFYNQSSSLAAYCDVELNQDYSKDAPKYLYLDMQDENAWYYQAVANVAHKGLMTGLSKHIFGPSRETSRAQVAMILYRMAGSPEVEYQNVFSDVDENSWYTKAVMWGYQSGVIKGYEDGSFGPSDDITREQLVTLLYRYCKPETDAKGSLDSFPDASYVSAFAKDAMEWAIGQGIITGMEVGGTRYLAPANNAVRAEIAQILTRLK